MKINEIERIAKKKAESRGYELVERGSKSSGSWYYKLYSGGASLIFRISDHKTKSDTITLRIDHKLNQKTVENFMENRCRDLSKRKMKTILGM